MSTAATAGALVLDGIGVDLQSHGRIVRIVDALSLTLSRGETLGLVGESGSGKSTVANAILRLLPPRTRARITGSIRLGDTELLSLPEPAMRGIRGRRIAMIPQDPMSSLNPLFTVGAQIAEALAAHGRKPDRAATRDAVIELLGRVRIDAPQTRIDQYPHELSGGMRQRVVGAIAIACEPEFLLADEPTTALDVTVQAQYLDMLADLQLATGLGLLFITHDLGVVARICDRVAVMYQGRIVETGSVEEIFERPQHSYTQALLASLPDPAQPAPRPLPVRRENSDAGNDQAPLLDAAGLGRRFDLRRGRGLNARRQSIRAVGDISLRLHAGESVGLVGESGCGKTTLSRLLLRLETPTSGVVHFRGSDLGAIHAGEYRAYRRAVQPVFQDPVSALDPRMRVGRIIAEPLSADGRLSRTRLKARVARVLEQVGLETGAAERYPHEFSGGQRQRIAIARALAVEPSLIVLDEAVSSQDVSIRAQLLKLLAEIRASSGVGYLFISHDLSNVRYLCERVVVMYLGRIVEQAPTGTLFATPQHPYTQALLGAWLPPDPKAERRPLALAGEVPSAAEPPAGCPFHPRCPQAMTQCREVRPSLQPHPAGGEVACHLYSSTESSASGTGLSSKLLRP